MTSPLRRLHAWAALLSFTFTFGLGVVTVGHFGPDDDAACGQSVLGGIHPSAQFETVKLAPPATHCPFCHWQRAVSGASLSAVNIGAYQPEPIARVIPAQSRIIASAIFDEHLSRGPPSLI